MFDTRICLFQVCMTGLLYLGAIQQLRGQEEGKRGVPWLSTWTKIWKKIQLLQKVFYTIVMWTGNKISFNKLNWILNLIVIGTLKYVQIYPRIMLIRIRYM